MRSYLDLPGYFYLLLRQYITLLNPNHHLAGHHADRQWLPGQTVLRQPVPRQIQLTVTPYLVHADMRVSVYVQ
ncbi:hypothetical protein [Serratia fonticola]